MTKHGFETKIDVARHNHVFTACRVTSWPLPSELTLQIAARLAPADALALSQTSRGIQTAIKQYWVTHRSRWILLRALAKWRARHDLLQAFHRLRDRDQGMMLHAMQHVPVQSGAHICHALQSLSGPPAFVQYVMAEAGLLLPFCFLKFWTDMLGSLFNAYGPAQCIDSSIKTCSFLLDHFDNLGLSRCWKVRDIRLLL